jgi:hypothetical protein
MNERAQRGIGQCGGRFYDGDEHQQLEHESCRDLW